MHDRKTKFKNQLKEAGGTFEGCVSAQSDRLRFAVERSGPWVAGKPWD
jgi:hypothetical protein